MEYLVTGNIQHDGKAYSNDDSIELSEVQAAQLIEAGVVRDPNAKEEVAAPSAPRAKKPKTKEESVVGGEPTVTGEPSIDGQQEAPKAEAQDVTPPTEAPNDPSADL